LNRVQIETNNDKIWNVQKITFELLKAAQKGPVIIDLLHEGPCCQHIGLTELLNQICEFLNVSKTHFSINTSNQISSSSYTERRTPFVELATAKKYCHKIFFDSTLEKRFGIFIGRSNVSRLNLASYLHKYHRNLTEMTFHYDHNDDFHQNNFGLEQFLEKYWDDRHRVFEFIEYLPIRSEQFSYPILWNQKGFDLDAQYKKIFCDIVCETVSSGDSFFITEKTLRCIANCRPFIINGPRHVLTNLKKLGFETFDRWWDEGYDSDPDDARISGIIGNIDWIAKQSDDTIIQWFKEMNPVLQHNVQVLTQLHDTDITKNNFYYESRSE
jgi:hypothetical protein